MYLLALVGVKGGSLPVGGSLSEGLLVVHGGVGLLDLGNLGLEREDRLIDRQISFRMK